MSQMPPPSSCLGSSRGRVGGSRSEPWACFEFKFKFEHYSIIQIYKCMCVGWSKDWYDIRNLKLTLLIILVHILVHMFVQIFVHIFVHILVLHTP